MSAVVCGKRSFFEELTSSPTSSSRHPCSNMDNQILEKVLDECDNDLDATIKRLHDLSLEYEAVNSAPVTAEESNENIEKGTNIEMSGAEWVELFVGEMMSATSLDDARYRATKVLECLEQSISARADAKAIHTYHKENLILKEKIELLLRENSILKRAVAIQHKRQKDYDLKNQEVMHLKQLLSQYQEQMRTLQLNNYALKMHFQQAQKQSISIPGCFNPDVF